MTLFQEVAVPGLIEYMLRDRLHRNRSGTLLEFRSVVQAVLASPELRFP